MISRNGIGFIRVIRKPYISPHVFYVLNESYVVNEGKVFNRGYVFYEG
jgi:hypothetical protein